MCVNACIYVFFISCVKGTLSVTQHMIETMDNYQNVNLQGFNLSRILITFYIMMEG